ncbi:pancortin-3 [Providencia alcalifaciens]|uniref:Cap15 family cyclic dinucleotide receptor domain-containing protein n=1 Tax=Providencia alcalifaciens TaxID=126385 RepID=UPI0015D02FEF|nr:pancortin-3 [Providencia alcalifaciens]MBF0690752.1 pancortin-3 [Providencia alcalifaciens]NYS89256.1 pancortin-3 [Providencia alcalifaciens]
MHDYAIFGHSRTTIGRWLGVLSVLISGGISSTFLWMQKETGFEVFSKAVLSTACIYFILHFIFNKYAWKIPFFKIPDINGIWEVQGETLSEKNGEIKYTWNATIDIEQTWEKIIIILKTSKSSSESYTATLGKKSGTKGGWILHYSYANNPETEQYHELNSHKGYCELIFDDELKSGKAAYFNSNGRRTFGKMTLTRIHND